MVHLADEALATTVVRRDLTLDLALRLIDGAAQEATRRDVAMGAAGGDTGGRGACAAVPPRGPAGGAWPWGSRSSAPAAGWSPQPGWTARSSSRSTWPPTRRT